MENARRHLEECRNKEMLLKNVYSWREKSSLSSDPSSNSAVSRYSDDIVKLSGFGELDLEFAVVVVTDFKF